MLTLITVAILAGEPDLRVTTDLASAAAPVAAIELKTTSGVLSALDPKSHSATIATPSGLVTVDVSHAVGEGPDHFSMSLAEMVGQPVQVWYTLEGAAIARAIELSPASAPPLVQAPSVSEQSVTGTLAAIDLWHHELVVTADAGPVTLQLTRGSPSTAHLQLGMRVTVTYAVDQEAHVTAIEVRSPAAAIPVS